MTMEEGTARFWTTVFSGITAITLVGGGIYSLFEYVSNKQEARANFALQLDATKRQAQQAYLSKQLELCTSVSNAAAVLAMSKDQTARKQALDTFNTLSLGGLRIVQDPQDQALSKAMTAFKNCLDGKCEPGQMETLSGQIADTCRSEIITSWEIKLVRKKEDADK